MHGDQDEFTSIENYDVWAESLRRNASHQDAGKLRIMKVEGANHFWNGEAGETLLETIRAWLS